MGRALASPRACTPPWMRAPESCPCATTRRTPITSTLKAAPASTDAEDHAVSRAHGGALREPCLASLGGAHRRELLRAHARARIPRHPHGGRAVRRLAALQIPRARPRRRAAARPDRHA